jgi:GNAT superfamily N-acetyltransferase
MDTLPNSAAPELRLAHPTPEESIQILTEQAALWSDSLTVDQHIQEAEFLSSAPLAKDGGQTNWILVDGTEEPGHRRILASCETIRKKALTSTPDGTTSDAVVHGIASVLCFPEYRGRGYAARLMKELAKTLATWQLKGSRCAGSVLYSDLGKNMYSKFGWHANPTNSHVEFPAQDIPKPPEANELIEADLTRLCIVDGYKWIRRGMSVPISTPETRVTIAPDLDHMLWHIRKEEFATQHLFGTVPQAKGAVSGLPDSLVWAIWTHRYYSNPADGKFDNVLYILRLVVQGDDSAFKGVDLSDADKLAAKNSPQVQCLANVLQSAISEAATWKLDRVELWDPSPLAQAMLAETGLEYRVVDRQEKSIACGLWYDDHGEPGATPRWVNNEKFAWL